MRKWMVIILALGLFRTGAWAASGWSETVANESGLAYDNNYVLDLQRADAASASAQAVYSSATYTAKTFTGGSQSTGTITVVTPSALAGSTSSNTITILSNSLPRNAEINLNGRSLTRNVHWSTGDVSSNTAVNIKNAIDALADYTASTATATSIAVRCAKAGVLCNSRTLSVNTSSMTVPQRNFTGGANPAVLAINGVSITAGVDYDPVATASGTAAAILAAMAAKPSINTIMTASRTGEDAVIYATSTAAGASANYSLYSSTQAALTVSGPVTVPSAGRAASAMTGGTTPAWTRSSSVITVVGHGYPLALNLLYTGTPAIGGLTDGTTYYAVPRSANTLSLASSKANAVAGTYITLTSSQSLTAANTYTLTPLAISGIPSFKWQASNDLTHWSDLSVSSVTMDSYTYGGETSAWDFGTPAYRYLRAKVIAPTQGAISLLIQAAGRTLRR